MITLYIVLKRLHNILLLLLSSTFIPERLRKSKAD